jgi:2-keto-4-pentenoate hydratase/2-oxohepta-3-ene-1,7-dioic acid hydratase in catechol pathway
MGGIASNILPRKQRRGIAGLVAEDVILTGTPGGIGPIQSGDRLEVRIQGLAPLLNSVK